MITVFCLNGRSFECGISLKGFLAIAEAVAQGHAEANLSVAAGGVMSMRRVDIERTMRGAMPDAPVSEDTRQPYEAPAVRKVNLAG